MQGPPLYFYKKYHNIKSLIAAEWGLKRESSFLGFMLTWIHAMMIIFLIHTTQLIASNKTQLSHLEKSQFLYKRHPIQNHISAFCSCSLAFKWNQLFGGFHANQHPCQNCQSVWIYTQYHNSWVKCCLAGCWKHSWFWFHSGSNVFNYITYDNDYCQWRL